MGMKEVMMEQWLKDVIGMRQKDAKRLTKALAEQSAQMVCM